MVKLIVHAIVHNHSKTISQGFIVGDLEPASYSLSLSSIDGIEESPINMLFATSFTRDTYTITVHVSQPLPLRRLWNYQVLAMGCPEHPLTNLLELSKFSYL